MPVHPTAEDVRRLRVQMRSAGRPDTWASGIEI